MILFKCCQRAQHTVRWGQLSGDSTRCGRRLKQWSAGHRLRPSVGRTKSRQIRHRSERIGPCSRRILALSVIGCSFFLVAEIGWLDSGWPCVHAFVCLSNSYCFADSHNMYNMYDRLIFYVRYFVLFAFKWPQISQALGLLWGHVCTLWLWQCLQFAVCLQFCYVVRVMIMSIDCVMSDSWVLHK